MLVHGISAQQRKVHLQLLGAVTPDRLAAALLLLRAQAAATARLFVSNAGLERCRRALTVQAQCCVDRRPAQTGLLDDLHHADTCLVHTDNLFAAFVQYFSRLLAGIFFLHKPLTTQIIKSPLLNRTSSTAYIALIQVPRPLSSGH